MNSDLLHASPVSGEGKNFQLDDEEGEPSGARAADRPACARQPTRTLRFLFSRLERHRFLPFFFVLLGAAADKMHYRISE